MNGPLLAEEIAKQKEIFQNCRGYVKEYIREAWLYTAIYLEINKGEKLHDFNTKSRSYRKVFWK